MNQESADKLISEFGAMIDMQELGFDETGGCTFEVIDSDIAVSIVNEPSNDRLVMMAALPHIEVNEQINQALLEANFVGGAARGATFAVDPVTQSLFLLQSLNGAIQPAQLATSLEDLIDDAIAWQEELSEPIVIADETETSASTPMETALGIRV